MELLIVSGLSGAGKVGRHERAGGYRLISASTTSRPALLPQHHGVLGRRATASWSGWRCVWMCAAAARGEEIEQALQELDEQGKPV